MGIENNSDLSENFSVTLYGCPSDYEPNPFTPWVPKPWPFAYIWPTITDSQRLAALEERMAKIELVLAELKGAVMAFGEIMKGILRCKTPKEK